MNKLQYDGPVVLAILDGVGLAPDSIGNAVSKARTAFLGRAAREYPHIALHASGEAVGLTTGQMGNSEVGHSTIGSGQIIKRGIARFDEAFATGEVFDNDTWREIVKHKNIHFAGIFSDGGVHSHNNHLMKMIERAYADGVRKMRIHAMLDGRDVAPQSAEKYIQEFEEFVSRFPDADIKIASAGGRMTTTSDRYEKDWGIVERGFNMIVYGDAPYRFHSALEGVATLRSNDPNLQDQFFPAFVVVDEHEQPVGKVEKGDALIYFDFRKDRAIEIAMAFTYYDFPYFNRGNYSPDDVYFVGLTEYNSDTHVPEHRLVEPQAIQNTLHEFLGQHEISQLAISETVKFGHITYYFDGDSYQKMPHEEFIEIESYPEPFEARPWMKSAEITDRAIENLEKYKFIRLNYPGGDMVGHSANVEATIVAMEAIDLSLDRLMKKVKELGGMMIIVADHGNAEELLDPNNEPKTSHTTNLIPCIFCDDTINCSRYRLSAISSPGLANLASTLALLLGQDNFPDSWGKPLITVL